MIGLGVLLLAQLSAPMGVVTAAKGEAEILRPESARLFAAKNGVLLYANDALETADRSWLEFISNSEMTVRLAAASQLTINDTFLVLGSGRIWIQTAGQADQRRAELRVWGAQVIIEHGSTVIAERVEGRGVNIFVALGQAQLLMKKKGLAQTISPGQSLWLKANAKGLHPQKTSNASWSLLRSEARAVLGDRIGLKRFLLNWIQKTQAAQVSTRATAQMPRTDSAIRGEIGTLFDSLLEAAIRPAAFFENEVPPKGPNVRVEVSFESP